MSDDYFRWQDRRTRPPRTGRQAEQGNREEPSRASEPIEVQELHASTTIIRRLRRYWTDRRG